MTDTAAAVNGNGPEKVENNEEVLSPLKEDYKRKHKRNSPPPGEKSPRGAPASGSTKVKPNDRHSRNGKGRGLPKKGGAGGKGTWGKPGVLYSEEELHCRDQKDLDYESDEEYEIRATNPELTEDEFEKFVPSLIKEFLNHGDMDDLADAIGGLNIETQKHKIVSCAINIAMDEKASERELVSQFISKFYGKQISQEAIRKGFEELLAGLDDTVLDIPGAAEMAGQFIARAVADDCLPPAFINSKTTSENGRIALNKAQILLKVKHGMSRLDNVWGVGGARQSVTHLRDKMILLIKEYFSSSDVKEAIRCVKELDVPHFHHELVYQTITLTLEDGTDRTLNLTLDLLRTLSESIIVTPNEMNQGFQRIFDAISDLALDIPHAPSMLEKFCAFCVQDNIIQQTLVSKIPTRGRKRYVSEGDGGRVKEEISYEVKA